VNVWTISFFFVVAIFFITVTLVAFKEFFDAIRERNCAMIIDEKEKKRFDSTEFLFIMEKLRSMSEI
jgi:hypothetical protein